jgi:hypothetical protein
MRPQPAPGAECAPRDEKPPPRSSALRGVDCNAAPVYTLSEFAGTIPIIEQVPTQIKFQPTA